MANIANSWWMYLLGIIVSVFVTIGSLVFIIQSYKDAKKIGMDKGILIMPYPDQQDLGIPLRQLIPAKTGGGG